MNHIANRFENKSVNINVLFQSTEEPSKKLNRLSDDCNRNTIEYFEIVLCKQVTNCVNVVYLCVVEQRARKRNRIKSGQKNTQHTNTYHNYLTKWKQFPQTELYEAHKANTTANFERLLIEFHQLFVLTRKNIQLIHLNLITGNSAQLHNIFKPTIFS